MRSRWISSRDSNHVTPFLSWRIIFLIFKDSEWSSKLHIVGPFSFWQHDVWFQAMSTTSTWIWVRNSESKTTIAYVNYPKISDVACIILCECGLGHKSSMAFLQPGCNLGLRCKFCHDAHARSEKKRRKVNRKGKKDQGGHIQPPWVT